MRDLGRGTSARRDGRGILRGHIYICHGDLAIVIDHHVGYESSLSVANSFFGVGWRPRVSFVPKL